MYYHNSVLAFVFGFGRGRLRAQKERLLGLIARPFLFPTLGAASADPNVLPRWAQSQMLIPNEDDNIWSIFGDCKTHVKTREENAHGVFWNLEVCHSYIHGWHRAKGVLGDYCQLRYSSATLPSFELGVAGLDPSTADHV